MAQIEMFALNAAGLVADQQLRHDPRNIVEIIDPAVRQFRSADGRDNDRNLDQRFGTFTRGDSDFFEGERGAGLVGIGWARPACQSSAPHPASSQS